LLLAVAFSVLMLIIALAIKAEDSGSVLFRQKRPGKNGKPFVIYKFRTMAEENSSSVSLFTDKERITKIGRILRKTSLDELPQLFNILRGEMSFVGPRPLLMQYLPLYSERQARRHEVLPGITGFAQVNGRNAITWEQKFEYDVIYVEKINIFLDIKIVLKTIVNVVKREGVDSSEDVTMIPYVGTGS
jgi:lipopolysaccharide/colanic/teichoic acid biosynthesis glycosyltransferase